MTDVPRIEIRTVVLTDGPRGDTRVLLCNGDGAVLAQDQAIFYSDDDLRRLAAALGCSFVADPCRSFAVLDRAHPGTLRYRWLRHPTLLGLLLGVLICGPILVIGLVTR